MVNKQNIGKQTSNVSNKTVLFNETSTKQVFLLPSNKPSTSQEQITVVDEKKTVVNMQSSFISVEDSGNDTENETLNKSKRFLDVKTSL